MSTYGKPRFWAWVIVAILGLAIAQQAWHWEIERVEVPAGKYLVRARKFGFFAKDLPEDQIVAPDDSHKGVMLDVLGEGRHFLNPLFWTTEKHDIVVVPAGTCLVLSRKFGERISDERLAAGEILASHDPANPFAGERGIMRDVLLPGSYRLNPYAYSWESVPAVEIRVDQVGVRALKIGLDPRQMPEDPKRGHYVVADGYRGVQQSTVPPGTYYINPYVESITPVEVRSHRVEFEDIQFPSRDGFILRPRVVVEYAVEAEKTPELLVRLTDDGVLHQRDETPQDQLSNEVLQKVILPHIRGYARIEGSNFDARDFILTATAEATALATPDPAATTDPAAPPAPPPNPVKSINAREQMQKALMEKVRPRCAELGVEIRAVTLPDMRPPKELADQIAMRELARVEQDKNKVLLRQHKAQQELAAKEGLKQQAKEKVEAQTRLIQAETKSDQLKEVEEARLKQELENAQIALEAARDQATASIAKGKAEAKVIELQNEAEVAGLKAAMRGFSSARNFAQYHMMAKLAPALAEIFASDESEFSRLFARYLTPSSEDESASPNDVPPAVANP